jgi:hypothetical protein
MLGAVATLRVLAYVVLGTVWTLVSAGGLGFLANVLGFNNYVVLAAWLFGALVGATSYYRAARAKRGPFRAWASLASLSSDQPGQR